MDSLIDSHQVRRLEVVETGRRRRFTLEHKLRIVEESFSAPRVASATARRHGISNTLLFGWRKAYREGCLGPASSTGFVPAMVVPEAVTAEHDTPPGRMEIFSANGRRVVVGRDVDAEALARVLDVLERRCCRL